MQASAKNNPLNIQLRDLIGNGLSAEDIAQCLDLDIDAVKMAMEYNKKRIVDVDQLIEQNQAACIQALIDIGLNRGDDYNPNVRVQALRIIVDKRGRLDELPIDRLSDTYKKMKEVCAEYNKVQLTKDNIMGKTSTLTTVNS